jgi:hypothetical protein
VYCAFIFKLYTNSIFYPKITLTVAKTGAGLGGMGDGGGDGVNGR